MKKLILLILLIFLINNSLSFSQTQQWVNNITNPFNAKCYGLVTDNFNNIYVCGTGSQNTEGSSAEGTITKYNSSGSIVWTYLLGLGTNCNDLKVDSLQNVYYSGLNNGYLFAGKVNADGTSAWSTTYIQPGTYPHIAGVLGVDKNFNVYSAGYAQSALCLIKYSAAGVEQWQRKLFIDPLGIYNVYEFAFEDTSSVYLVSSYNLFFTISKYSSQGDSIWTVRTRGPGGTTSGSARSIKTDKDNNIYVTGFAVIPGQTNDILTGKYTSAGVLIWEKNFSGPISSTDRGNNIILDDSSNCFITGVSGNKIITLKYDSSGVLKWSSLYSSGVGSHVAFSLARDVQNNIFVAGSSLGDFVTIKYNSVGNQIWAMRYTGTSTTSSQILAVGIDNNGGVYTTGTSKVSGSITQITTIKYQDDVLPVELVSFSSALSGNTVILKWTVNSEENNSGFDIERKSTETDWRKIGYVQGRGTINTATNYTYSDNNLSAGKYYYRLKQIDYNGNYKHYHLSIEVEMGIPVKYSLSQNYPNPFNPNTVVNYQMPVAGFVQLKVYDNLGNEVETLVNEKQNAGSYSVTFNGANLSSGIYFYMLEAGDYNETKKMILVK